MKRLLIAMLSMPLIASCASRNIDGANYTENKPDFRLEQFFNGAVKAWGIVQDRSGNVTQQFIVAIDGRYTDGVLTLDETFEYSLGEGVTERIWSIRKDALGGWIGDVDDILPSATGADFGNAFRWRYRMDLPVGETSYRVNFDDWIWAFDENTIMNRSYITKFGITFAEVTIFMQKQ